jgi:hypothetical protein
MKIVTLALCFVLLCTPSSAQPPPLPCDAYAHDGSPCVAAHSMVRALYASYDGALYSIMRASDNATADVLVATPGGFADSASQDRFCAGTHCVVLKIVDQSPFANHLTTAPPGGAKRTPDKPVDAFGLKVVLSGHAVYAAFFDGGKGYRIDNTTGVSTGNQPQSMYMVTSGRHYNDGCCFDYGNAETNNLDDKAGTMEAIYFGNCSGWGHGTGPGPWVLADLEDGLWGGDTKQAQQPSINADFVTAMVKGSSDGFTIKAADASARAGLTTYYAGRRPDGYQPMRKQGAIILGIGGDNSDSAIGVFFEGAMTASFSSDSCDSLIQRNIAEVYGSSSTESMS